MNGRTQMASRTRAEHGKSSASERHRANVSVWTELVHVFNGPIWEADAAQGPHFGVPHDVNFADWEARGRAIIEMFFRGMPCKPSKGKRTRPGWNLAIIGVMGLLSRLASVA